MPTCRCGHDRHHHMVSPSAEYTFFGWLLTLIGISARPTAIKFVCRQCGDMVERTHEPSEIRETRLWG